MHERISYLQTHRARQQIIDAMSNLDQMCPDDDDIDSVELKHLPYLRENLKQALKALYIRKVK